jgi:hypothetical protein
VSFELSQFRVFECFGFLSSTSATAPVRIHVKPANRNVWRDVDEFRITPRPEDSGCLDGNGRQICLLGGIQLVSSRSRSSDSNRVGQQMMVVLVCDYWGLRLEFERWDGMFRTILWLITKNWCWSLTQILWQHPTIRSKLDRLHLSLKLDHVKITQNETVQSIHADVCLTFTQIRLRRHSCRCWSSFPKFQSR